MTAQLSFLPTHPPRRTSLVRRLSVDYGSPACREVTRHQATSDPRYVLRIVEVVQPKGLRMRSTMMVERATGKTVDYLHLVSNDHGRTWKARAIRG